MAEPVAPPVAESGGGGESEAVQQTRAAGRGQETGGCASPRAGSGPDGAAPAGAPGRNGAMKDAGNSEASATPASTETASQRPAGDQKPTSMSTDQVSDVRWFPPTAIVYSYLRVKSRDHSDESFVRIMYHIRWLSLNNGFNVCSTSWPQRLMIRLKDNLTIFVCLLKA